MPGRVNGPPATDVFRQTRQAILHARQGGNGASPVPSVEQSASIADIMEMEFEPVEWVVEELLPPGVGMLAGKPKCGKSWLVLEIAMAVATGGALFGKHEVACGDVLYIALEDTYRRIQSRVIKAGYPAPSNLFVETTWPRADQNGLMLIQQWLEKHPECRLVIIDTMALFKAKREEGISYDDDYEIGRGLKQIVGQRNMAILLVHHVRKGKEKVIPATFLEEVSGTMGLTGSMDTIQVLARDAETNDADWLVTGKDIEGDPHLALSWNAHTARWERRGSLEQVRASEQEDELMRCLREIPGASLAQVSMELDIPKATAKKRLQRAQQRGLVARRMDGKGYTLL